MDSLDKKDWTGGVGASASALSQLQKLAHAEIPSGYYEFLAVSDGGEGPLPVAPYNACLDNVGMMLREVPDRWHQEWVTEGFFPIGGNGAGELIGFDLRNPAPFAIIYVDMIAGMDSAEVIALNWEKFSELLGRQS